MSVGRDLISRVTDAVIDDVREWAKRPLQDIYPIVFLDCMVIKVREGGSVQRRALYLALGVTLDGDRDVLGMWFQKTEGAKFWMQVLTDLKTRGLRDILIACVRSERGSRWIEPICSIRESCRLQRRSVTTYLTDAATAAHHGRPIPSLAPT